MPKTRNASPARSQGAAATPPRYKTRASRSVCSPALSTASGRLTSIIDQFKDKNAESFALSPVQTRRSILPDTTDIEEPRRKSWWKKLNENSRDVIEVLEHHKGTEVHNAIEDIVDMEILSQEKKNYTLDLPESSDNESINSIVLPQRKLFTQKENVPQKKFGKLVGARETLAKLQKTNTTQHEKTINAGVKELFQGAKRSKPVFPAALLNISPNKTAADKTKENVVVEPKAPVRSIFGNRPNNKRKNIFADFVVSESEDEISDIQPKVFGFQKRAQQRRISAISKGSPVSNNTTDLELDEWKHLPSSTMVENQIDEMMANQTPVKRARLSKVSEAKESELGTTVEKTKLSNKSASKTRISPRNNSKVDANSSETPRNTRRSNLNSSKQSKSQVKRNSIVIQDEDPDRVSILVVREEKKKQTEGQTEDTNRIVEREMDEKELPKVNIIMQKPNQSISENQVLKVNIKMVDDKLNKSKTNIEATTKDKSHHKSNTSKIANQSKTVNDTKGNKIQDEEYREAETEPDDEIYLDEPDYVLKGNDIGGIVKDSASTVKEATAPVKEAASPVKEKAAHIKEATEPVKEIAKPVKETTEHVTVSSAAANHDKVKVEDKSDKENKEELICNNDDDDDDDGDEAGDNGDNELENDDGLEDNENVAQDDNESDSEDFQNLNYSEEEVEKEDSSAHDKIKTTVDNPETVDHSDAMDNHNEIVANKIIADSDEKMDQYTTANKQNITLDRDNNVDKPGKIVDYDSTVDDHNKFDQTSTIGEVEKSVEVTADESNKIASDIEDNHDSADHEDISKGDENTAEENDITSDNNESVSDDQENVDTSNESDQIVNDNDSTQMEEDNEEVLNESESEVENDRSEILDLHEQSDDDDEIVDDHESIEGSHDKSDDQHKAQNKNKLLDNEQMAYEEKMVYDEKTPDQPNEFDAVEHEWNVHQKVNSVINENVVNDTDIGDDEDEEMEEIREDDQESHADEASGSNNEETLNESVKESDSERDDEQDGHNTSTEKESDYEILPPGADDSDILRDSMEIDDDETEASASQDAIAESPKDKKMKSPEVILRDKSNLDASFSPKRGPRNTSFRKTKSMYKESTLRPSLAPPRDSLGLSDGPRDSSAEGSEWDSHRTTRKTLRQTFGKDFSVRKSLRALVMEKSAKQTKHMETIQGEISQVPEANSTEYPEDCNHEENVTVSDPEVSIRTRQTTLQDYLEKIKQKNMEKRSKMEEAITNSLKAPAMRDSLNLFKVPLKPPPRLKRAAITKPKKQATSSVLFKELPSEVIEDMKYKPPKRFKPSNASWITKRLYKFLESKLEPKYDYKARIRAEKLVETIYEFTKDLRRHAVAAPEAVDRLKSELARLDVVKSHFDFYEFFHEFMPREVRVKVVPDVVNKIPLPRHGVFSDIIRGTAVQG